MFKKNARISCTFEADTMEYVIEHQSCTITKINILKYFKVIVS
ncbi:MAG: hypothetical protein JWN56_1004 [Sphingobacteriales bacterium]|nr:hypothetical protein [Sphingobacteriales bacterium]